MDRMGENDSLREKSKAYCGTVKIPLYLLKHEGPEQNPRQLNAKNVNRLLRIFELEGCLRLETENHIPALVSQEMLIYLLSTVQGEEAKLKKWNEHLLFFQPFEALTILHGRHRLEAARKFLRYHDKWWVVDLFLEQYLSLATQITIREEDQNAARFCDGDIFRHLRYCQTIQDREGKKKWLSKLSATKQRDVLQLEKRADKEKETAQFMSAWDSLLPFPGLWHAVQLGTFHRLLSLRCPEVCFRWEAPPQSNDDVGNDIILAGSEKNLGSHCGRR